MTLRIKYEMLTAKGKIKLKKDNGDDVLTDEEAAVETEKLMKKLRLDKVRVVKTVTDTFDIDATKPKP